MSEKVSGCTIHKCKNHTLYETVVVGSLVQLLPFEEGGLDLSLPTPHPRTVTSTAFPAIYGAYALGQCLGAIDMFFLLERVRRLAKSTGTAFIVSHLNATRAALHPTAVRKRAA